MLWIRKLQTAPTSAKHIYLDDDPFDRRVPKAASSFRRRMAKLTVAAMGVLLAFGTLAPASPVAAAPNKLHPKLQKAQVAAGTELVDVLITLAPDASWPDIVKAVGGKYVKHWQIARTVQVQVPQDMLPSLSSLPGVKWVTPNAKVVATGLDANLATVSPKEIGADAMWNRSYTGSGVTVAVLDTGLSAHPDLTNTAALSVPRFSDGADYLGHGTAVAGVIAGHSTDGKYMGIAPDARIISVKVLADDGSGTLADVLTGLEWVNENFRQYGIRVVNLSLTAGMPDGYRNNPINAAVETLWFNGVTVIAAAGNFGSSASSVASAPGNDPFVITVGAVNDQGTTTISDDTLATFSSRGTTLDGFAKPDLTAPGQSIITTLAPGARVVRNNPSSMVDTAHLKASGTSLAAPAVSGAVALLLQARPDLTPNQIKWLLTASTQKYLDQGDGAGVIDVPAALSLAESLPAIPSANQGLQPAEGIVSTADGAALDQIYWDQIYWDQIYWDQIYWDQIYWDQ